MATRSNIAIKNDDGTVEMIYCFPLDSLQHRAIM